MHQTPKCFLLLCVVSILAAGMAQANNVVLADFEGTDYGDWKATRDAFGHGIR